MVENANLNAAAQNINDAEFHAMPGEEISSLEGTFKLVTFGSALHWMDIPKTLGASSDLLSDDGGVVILGMRSIWGGKSDWERVVVRIIQKWMGSERRAGSTTFNQPGVSFVHGLTEAEFSVFEENSLEAEYTVDVPFILGHLYTTSYCNRDLLGDSVDDFETDLNEQLLGINSDGVFRWVPRATYIFARKTS